MPRGILVAASVVLTTGVIVAAGVVSYVVVTGLSARPHPGALETRVARTVRSLAIPADVGARANPVPATREAFEEGMAHFADHCANCHANDGSGQTSIGQGLFPKPPDLRGRATQDLTDGALFYIVENGVRFTGMPAFATGDDEGEQASWKLVRFMRGLPSLTADDRRRMEGMNPRPPAEIRREIEDEQFLQGAAGAPPAHQAHEGEPR